MTTVADLAEVIGMLLRAKIDSTLEIVFRTIDVVDEAGDLMIVVAVGPHKIVAEEEGVSITIHEMIIRLQSKIAVMRKKRTGR